MVCETHKDLSVWECVTSRIRTNARLSIPYETRGLLYLVIDALDLIRRNKMSPAKARSFALMVDAAVKVLQTGIIQVEKKFERRCRMADIRDQRSHRAQILEGPSLEELQQIAHDATPEVQEPGI